MLGKLSQVFADFLIRKGTIKQEEKAICEYGMVLSLTTLLGMISILFISLIFKWYWGFLYLMVYTPLRIYCGGHHCSTYTSCFMVTNIVFFINMLVVKTLMALPLSKSIIIASIVLITTYAFILYKAPIVNAANPLSPKRLLNNRQRSVIVATVHISIAFILMLLGSENLFFQECCFIITSSEATVSVLMIFQIIKERRMENVEHCGRPH